MSLCGVCHAYQRHLHGLVQARETLCLEAICSAISIVRCQAELIFSSRTSHAQLTSLRLSFALLQSPLSLDHLLGHLFVKLHLVLI